MSHETEMAAGRLAVEEAFLSEAQAARVTISGPRWLSLDPSGEEYCLEFTIGSRQVRVTIDEDDLADASTTPAILVRYRNALREELRKSSQDHMPHNDR